jgi:hypothetical protein
MGGGYIIFSQAVQSPERKTYQKVQGIAFIYA